MGVGPRFVAYDETLSLNDMMNLEGITRPFYTLLNNIERSAKLEFWKKIRIPVIKKAHIPVSL